MRGDEFEYVSVVSHECEICTRIDLIAADYEDEEA